MSKKTKIVAMALVGLGAILLAAWYLSNQNIAVLNPAGSIASKERSLIITSTLLMLIVVVPVFIMTAAIAWRYREAAVAKYSPDWDHNPVLEFAWWAIPGAIIFTLAIVTWNSSHQLDPFRSLASDKKPLTIQVVALQWRWLFIYPQQGIASMNIVQIPQQTPINFEVTSDAPMNSFWIPQLGGQIYAMPGMATQLHLMANSTGSFRGSSANISGQGFAKMDFTARSTTQAGFDYWVKQVKGSTNKLSLAAYNNLSRPSQNNSLVYFSSSQPGLFDQVVAKYLYPASQLPYISTNHSHGGGL